MNKLKKDKGITLIALIITIVILLILAVVAIGAIQDSKIIAHAQNTTDKYESEKGKEENTISDAENLLDKYATKRYTFTLNKLGEYKKHQIHILDMILQEYGM